MSELARLHHLERFVFPFAEALVPMHKRAEWVREWRAELWQLQHGDRRAKPERGELMESVSLAYGLIADAAWLRVDWLQETAPGSAGWCLTALSVYCVLCTVAERVLAGSWHALLHVLAAHFMGNFVFVAVPALFVAIATYPLRPLRCDGRHVRPGGFLSARARWNLFLVAKLALTLALGFLATLVAMAPIRVVIGQWATWAVWAMDWIELLTSAAVVTASLRWALLNQEQRCQRCLRMLGQPTRVGRPSRNFLDWSGTELVCADGHGRLHVPEMQGSWCWYDLWVELDSGWAGLFS
jgi:hypothetical protein